MLRCSYTLTAGAIKCDLLQALQVRIRTMPKLKGTVKHYALRFLEPAALVA